MARIVAEDKEIGPFFVGDQLPPLFLILTWDTGGFVDLNNFPSASFNVRRAKSAISSSIMSGTTGGGNITYGILTQGQVNVIWPSSFLETGNYFFRLTLTDATSKKQSVQRLYFEVRDL